MANHVRRQIREAVAARLTGLTTTASRVYTNRVDPLEATQVPALTIRNGEEFVERASLSQPNVYIRRRQSIIVTAHVAAATAPWDTIDQICKEVEVALFGTIDALTLGGLALDVEMQGIDAPRISGDGDRIVASADIMLRVLLNAREGIPDAVI